MVEGHLITEREVSAKSVTEEKLKYIKQLRLHTVVFFSTCSFMEVDSLRLAQQLQAGLYTERREMED